MEKYYEGILIRSASFRLIDVKNYKNGKRYEIINDEKDKQYLYSLNYSDFNNFMSNNYGATDELKLNKNITVYMLDGQLMVVESENGELLFLRDSIKEEKDNLVYLSDYNIKYLSKCNVDIDGLLSFIKNEHKLILK